MTLYDRSVDLQARLEAAQAADTSDELLNRARRVIDTLDRTSEYLEQIPAFQTTAHISDPPDLDQRACSQAVAAFRAGLSRHGPAALQHQPASALEETAKAQRDRAARWVRTRWKSLLATYDDLLERERTGKLIGDADYRLTAGRQAAALRAAQSLDPIADVEQLSTVLGGRDVGTWLASAHEKGRLLREAIAALDREHEALTPEVQEVLRRAASADGLPLGDISPELLAKVHLAGVDDHLVIVRRT